MVENDNKVMIPFILCPCKSESDIRVWSKKWNVRVCDCDTYTSPFYEILHSALRPGGVVCTQAESLWLHLDLIKELHSVCSNVFKDKDGNGDVRYAYTTIPTYPSGQIGFMMCQKKSVQESSQKLGYSRRNAPPSLKYYSNAIHEAAFVLPKFAEDALSM